MGKKKPNARKRNVPKADNPRYYCVCQYCGCDCLTIQCSEAVCKRATHSWCSILHAGSSSSLTLCRFHFAARYRLPLIPLRVFLSQLATGELSLPQDISEKAACNSKYGLVFWDYISQVYYHPPLTSVETVEKYLDFAGEFVTESENYVLRPSSTFVEHQLGRTQKRLEGLNAYLLEGKRRLIASVTAYIQREVEYCQALPASEDFVEQKGEYLLSAVELQPHCGVNDQFAEYVLRKHLVVGTSSDSGEEESLCMVCAAAEHSETNVLIICSGCEECVHQQCYNLPQVPDGDWFCEPCSVFGARAWASLRCALCPVRGGALKPTANRNDGSVEWAAYKRFSRKENHSAANAEMLWCHVMCVKGVKGVRARRTAVGEEYDLRNISRETLHARCGICNSTEGVCIRCSEKNCTSVFHVECTKKLYKAATEKDRIQKSRFCKTHSPTNIQHIRSTRIAENVKALREFWHGWSAHPDFKSQFLSQLDPSEGVPKLVYRPVDAQGLLINIDLRKGKRAKRVAVVYVEAPRPLPMFTSATTSTMLAERKETCPCGKPYVAQIAQRGLSDEDYAEVLREQSMVSCDQCAQWFHYRCVTFTSDPEASWLCTACRR